MPNQEIINPGMDGTPSGVYPSFSFPTGPGVGGLQFPGPSGFGVQPGVAGKLNGQDTDKFK